MKTFKYSLQIVSFVSLFALAACGDGWEVRPYDGTPYDGERTAGRGVEYVRAKMAPQKGPVIEAAQPENTAVIMEAPPPAIVPADNMFSAKTRK